MRVAFVGVSHWHARRYYRPAARLPGVQIVGVADPDPRAAEAAARELDVKAFTDIRDLIGGLHPDFVFAFGRHCDMAETALALIDEGVPFLVEKPAGLTSDQVAAVRDRARAKGVYACTGFNFRVSDMFKRIQSITGDNPMTHGSFRYIGGGPYRYREDGCSWMLDPKLSGGGSTINLSIHFFDMFRMFSGNNSTEVASMMGRSTWGLPIEDYSAVILRSPHAVCNVETGYTFPVQHGSWDQRFSIRTSRHYIVVRGDNVVEVHRTVDGAKEEFATTTSNGYWYPLFVSETLDRFARGQPPVADLDDLVEAMRAVDAAYASDRAGGASITVESN